MSYELGDIGVGMAISYENKDFDIPYWTQVFIAKPGFDYDFAISEENKKDSIIYEYTIEPSEEEYPSMIDTLGLELIFYNEVFNINIDLKDIPEELDVCDKNYEWAVIIEEDYFQYKFFLNDILWRTSKKLLYIKIRAFFLEVDSVILYDKIRFNNTKLILRRVISMLT